MTSVIETGQQARPTSPVAELATDEMAAWRAFLHAHARLVRRLDDELQAATGLSLAEYDALVQLVGAPDRRLRMSVLAERVVLSRSGITRLVDRLVAGGMVERTACTSDARGAEAALTPIGVDALRAATGTHLGGVRRYFLNTTTAGEQTVIAQALDRVSEGLGRTQPTAELCAGPKG